MSAPLPKKTYPFISWRKKAFVFSLGLFLFFVLGIAARGGLARGIDFVGGTSVILKFDKPVDREFLAQLRDILQPKGLGENIRSVGGVGGGDARELAVEVRGSGWVDGMVAKYLEIREKARAEGPLTVAAVRRGFDGVLEAQALTDLVAAFGDAPAVAPAPKADTAARADTGAAGDTAAPAAAPAEIASVSALYNPDRITQAELTDLFQSLFNENISISVQRALDAALNAQLAPMQDLNAMRSAVNLSEALAAIRVRQLAEAIKQMAPADSGPRPWATVDEFMAKMFLTRYDNPALRQNLYADTSSRAGAVSILKGSPEELAAVFMTSIEAQYRPTAEILVSYRDRDHGGLYTAVDQATAHVPAEDAETKDLIAKNFYAGRFIVASSETVGPSVGSDLTKAAGKAVLWSLVGILIYVWYQFQLRYGCGAILATFHDAVMTVGFIGITGIELSIPIVAGILTVIGYSINDTIVVYDRIREKVGKYRAAPDPALIDLAITEMMTRTMKTSLTALSGTLAFLVFGPSAIFDLSLVLTFGLFIGTYSSIFIAAPVLVEWDRLFAARKPARPGATPGRTPSPKPAR